jgi:hypothetical protein
MIARGEINVQKKNCVQHTLLGKSSTIRADLAIFANRYPPESSNTQLAMPYAARRSNCLRRSKLLWRILAPNN